MVDVKSGYKRTEIGVIPEDWDMVRLGDLIEFRNGVNADKDAYGQGVPFINVLEIITKSHLYTSDIPGRVSLSRNLTESFAVRRGDIVFNRTSETQEEVGLASVYLGDDEIVFGGFVIRGRPIRQSMNAIYSGYILRAPIVRTQIIAKGQGAIRANVGQGDLRQVFVPLPPTLAEQYAIANTLGEVDDQITALDDLITKKRDLKQAAMQRLLTGEERLLGFSGAWEVKKLSEIGEALIGLTYSPNDVVEDGILVLRSSNIQNDRLAYEDNVFVDVTIPDQIITRKNDILICVRNGSRALIGKCALIDGYAIGMTFGAFMSVFRTKYARFVFYQFQSDLIKKQIEKNIGATINQITNKNLYSFEIPFPTDEEEQKAIAAVLSDMDAEISALEAQREKTIALKQGMMQELLTGKMRLI